LIVEVAGDAAQRVYFRCREEILCDVGVTRFPAAVDAFDIDADISVPGDGDEGNVV
jgi:hypothetical protein